MGTPRPPRPRRSAQLPHDVAHVGTEPGLGCAPGALPGHLPGVEPGRGPPGGPTPQLLGVGVAPSPTRSGSEWAVKITCPAPVAAPAARRRAPARPAASTSRFGVPVGHRDEGRHCPARPLGPVQVLLRAHGGAVRGEHQADDPRHAGRPTPPPPPRSGARCAWPRRPRCSGRGARPQRGAHGRPPGPRSAPPVARRRRWPRSGASRSASCSAEGGRPRRMRV